MYSIVSLGLNLSNFLILKFSTKKRKVCKENTHLNIEKPQLGAFQ